MDEFTRILGDAVIYLTVIYSILYLIGFVRNNKAYKYFTAFLVTIGVIQIMLHLYNQFYPGENSLHLFIYYFVFQFVLLSFFYKQLLGLKWIMPVTVITLLFIGYQYIDNPGMYYKYNPLGSVITQSIIILYGLIYFYKSLSGKKEFLIVNIGIFFYFLSSILVFASGNLTFNTEIPESLIWLLAKINLVLYFIFQILVILEWFLNYSNFKIKTK